jgi:hypothetical protein
VRRPKFVVIGCSRSGTKYMATLLSAVGYAVRHEQVFNPWPCRPNGPTDHFAGFPDVDGDSSFMAVPFLEDLPSATVVLHQLRDPIVVIRSHLGIRFFADHYQPSEYLAWHHPHYLRLIQQHCPRIFAAPDELTRCIRYWVMWNRMAQRAQQINGLRYLRYRVEALDQRLLRMIITLLGGDHPDEVLDAALASVPRSTNTRLRDESISWDTLPEGDDKDALKDLASAYGYPVPAGALRGS